MRPLPRPPVTLSSVLLAMTLTAWPAAQGAKPASAMPVSQPATVRSITRTALPRGDRITIELSREVTYTAARVPDPDRLFFDVPNSIVPGPTGLLAQSLTGTWITGVRVGQHSETAMRIVLQLTGAPRYSVFALYGPFRLVIDLERVLEGDMAPARANPVPVADVSSRAQPPPLVNAAPAVEPSTPVAPAPTPTLAVPATGLDLPLSLKGSHSVLLAVPAPPGNTAHGDYSISRQLGLGVSRIVIDPGHGGRDPGAQGNGIDEANLVLDVALRLEGLLKAESGFEVIMTRRTDQFVPLEERTAMANREGADLFLSIHANAARDPTARGIETYFLNFASTPSAEAVAARENATGTRTMSNLSELVKSITLNDKVEESREFATIVQNSMLQDLRTAQRPITDLGVKQAPFIVLIGAQMPSVLAEISFVTNKSDASLLKEPGYRQAIAQSLFDAILRYRVSLKRVTPIPGRSGTLH